MDCTRSAPRLLRPITKRLGVRRTFSTTPRTSQLGAVTYAQEWQTGTYHYNKAHTKTLPVATRRVDNLLTAWMTQQKKRPNTDESSETYRLFLRNAIAAQRRKTDSVLVSGSTAKDFGDRVEVTAFVYDGVEAAELEVERLRKQRMGIKADAGQAGAKKTGPVRRRRGTAGGAGGDDGIGGGAGGAGTRSFTPRTGGGAGPQTRGAGLGSNLSTGFRRVAGLGTAPSGR